MSILFMLTSVENARVFSSPALRALLIGLDEVWKDPSRTGFCCFVSIELEVLAIELVFVQSKLIDVFEP